MAINPFMESKDVISFIKGFALGRTTFQNDSTILKDLVKRLTRLAKEAKSEEESFYERYHVKSVHGLQSRLDAINQDNALKNMQARAITSSEWGKEISNEQFSTSQVVDALKDSIHGNTDFVNELVNIIIADVEEQFNQGDLTRSVDMGKPGQKTKISTNHLKNLLIEAIKTGNKLPRAYAKDLRILYHGGTELHSIESGMTFTIDLPDFNELPSPNNITTYPYFNLSPNAIQLACGKDGDTLWTNFKHWISEGSIHAERIESVMDKMGRENFVTAGSSLSNIKGILGELSALVFISILTDSDSIGANYKWTANWKRKAEEGSLVDIDIDLLLEDTGFQIKNYNGYDAAGQVNYHLTPEFSWSQLDSRFSGSPYETIYESIKDFYATRAFNQPNEKFADEGDFEGYRNFYENLISSKNASLNNSINAFFAGQIEKLIPLQTFINASAVEEADRDYRSKTVFYIFGAKRIIPASAMFFALATRLDIFINRYITNDRTEFGYFRANTRLSAEQYKSLYNNSNSYNLLWAGKNMQRPSEADILDKLMGLKFDFNIYMEDFQKYLDFDSSAIIHG